MRSGAGRQYLLPSESIREGKFALTAVKTLSCSAVELAPVCANVQLLHDLVPARHCFPRRCPTSATCPAHATSEIKAFER